MRVFSDVSSYFKNRIRGNDINDIFVVGDFGLIAHYNGLTWWQHPETFSGSYDGIDTRNNIIIAVGECGSKARIIKMHRGD